MIGCKTRLLPHIIYQNNSKWFSGLGVKVKTVKFLKENIGVNIHDLGSGNGLLGKTKAGAKNEKKKINWASNVKLLHFQGIIKKVKRHSIEWEKHMYKLYIK